MLNCASLFVALSIAPAIKRQLKDRAKGSFPAELEARNRPDPMILGIGDYGILRYRVTQEGKRLERAYIVGLVADFPKGRTRWASWTASVRLRASTMSPPIRRTSCQASRSSRAVAIY